MDFDLQQNGCFTLGSTTNVAAHAGFVRGSYIGLTLSRRRRRHWNPSPAAQGKTKGSLFSKRYIVLYFREDFRGGG